VSSPAKIARIRGYGAELVVAAILRRRAGRQRGMGSAVGALPVHAFDQPETLLGQGTLALELEQQAHLDTLLVAVGGGGLIGGIAAWYAGRVQVVGVEPEARAHALRALRAGGPSMRRPAASPPTRSRRGAWAR